MVKYNMQIIEVCAMKKTNQKADGMAQWVKHFVYNAGDLSPASGDHVKEEGDNRLHNVDL